MDVLQKMEQAGFNVELIEGRLSVTPASKLSPDQDEWIRGHKDELIKALRLRDLELKPSPSGHDHQAANDPPGPIRVTAWTPLGNPLEVTARDQEHADWIIRMNPRPKEEPHA